MAKHFMRVKSNWTWINFQETTDITDAYLLVTGLDAPYTNTTRAKD